MVLPLAVAQGSVYNMKVSLPRSVLLANAADVVALWLPRPGTRRGACWEGCGHLRCKSMRQVATSGCYLCGRPLGWEAPIYEIAPEGAASRTPRRLVHALCIAKE